MAGDLANSTRLCAVEGVVYLNGLRVIQIENTLPRNPYPPTSGGSCYSLMTRESSLDSETDNAKLKRDCREDFVISVSFVSSFIPSIYFSHCCCVQATPVRRLTTRGGAVADEQE